ncbi:MAG: efflux RND transporter periplasmic adaptor subunit [Litorimonas sp.]
MISRALTVALAGAALLSGCAAQDDTPDAVMELSAVPATPGEITRVIGATGKIVPRTEVMVGSEVSGRLLDVLVDYNSQVEEGQVLAIIDPTNFQNRVDQLEGRIRSALAEIEVQEARIRSAEVTLAQARQNRDRRLGLFAQQAVSEAQMEQAERDVGVAEASLDVARAQLKSQRASIAQVRSELGTARQDLARATITSPIDGVIIDRKVDPGQTVQASFSAPELFTIAADLSEIMVEARIVESDVAGLDPGDTAKFTVDAYPDRTIEGSVEQLRLQSVEANNIVSYVAVVKADNPDRALMPGMTANLEITTEVRSGVSRLPVTAERFRPSPEQVARFQADSAETEAPTLLDPTYDRLRTIGIADDRIQAFAARAEPSTQGVRDIINDPTKSFMHTPMRIQLGEIVNNQVRQFLSPDENSRYQAQVTLERTIRPVDVWVATEDGKMAQRTIKLGLSDGAFVQVVSGLNEGERVVTGIRAAGAGGGRPGGSPGGGRPGASR